MLTRTLILPAAFGICATLRVTPALAQGADICLLTAERVSAGAKLSNAEKAKAHDACQRALSATGSVLQKYQFQEADFAILGTPRKN